MPRNLTDLMETAVASAPPEPHQANDITRLAQRHQRRRTTFVAAGAALAVVAVAGGAVGVTRGGHDASPEPAAPYQYGQVVSPSDAVPATSVPGFHEIQYALKAVDGQPQTRQMDQQGIPNPPYAEYTDVDAEGRLIVERREAGETSPVVTEVLAGPSASTSSAQVPPPPTTDNTVPITWLARFVGDGRLMWVPSAPVVKQGDVGIHVTDLTGAHDRPLVLDHSRPGPPAGGSLDVWVSGDRLWFVNPESSKTDLTAPPTYALYSTPLDDPAKVTLVADHTAGAVVSGGTVGWVTPDGRGFLGSTDGGAVSSFELPLDEGCTVYPWGGEFDQVAVTDGLLAFAEQCGTGDSMAVEAVVVDASGRVILHVRSQSAAYFAMGDGVFVFAGSDPSAPKAFGTYHADLRTGVFSQLGGDLSSVDRAPVVAGRFVLWHDSDSFHVGEFGAD
jgi:hypothetical protein